VELSAKFVMTSPTLTLSTRIEANPEISQSSIYALVLF
jgi:hypothetical protein